MNNEKIFLSNASFYFSDNINFWHCLQRILILFLLLSHSIIVNAKIIEIVGVIGLLIVLEFIYLLLHPFLEKSTNHSPVVMLLALVCIASLIVPMHHRFEKWMIHKLVEKNRKIRLAAAKKTISELEEKKLN